MFWVGRRGYVGYGVVTGPARVPKTRDDAPWAGGKYRFTAVVPMKVLVEVQTPIFLPFSHNVQSVTGLNTAYFQRGMSVMSDRAATSVTEQLLDRYLHEEHDGATEGAPPN